MLRLAGIGARQHAGSQVQAYAGMHAHAEGQPIGAGQLGSRPMRVVVGGIGSKDADIPVGCHQVDRDQVLLGGILSRGQMHRAGGPPAGGRARRMQTHALVDGALQKETILLVTQGIFRMLGAPGE